MYVRRKRRLSRRSLILGIFFFSCFYMLIVVEQLHPPPPAVTVDISDPWEEERSLDSKTTTFNLIVEEGFSNVPPLFDLLDRFGSHTIQIQTTSSSQQPKTQTEWEETLSPPCIWVASKTPIKLVQSQDGKEVWSGPSHCFYVIPKRQLDDDWTLHPPLSSIVAIKNAPPVCLSNYVGPRKDFIKRGENFKHVYLWILASSERTHRVNAVFAYKEWLDTSSSVLSSMLMNNNDNSTDTQLLITPNQRIEYKPVEYIHDLLTSTFTLFSTNEQEEQQHHHDLPFWIRLQEAIVSGTIPIVVSASNDKLASCNAKWLLDGDTSPIPIASSWEQVLPTLLRLLKETPEEWNKRQNEIRNWYLQSLANRAVTVESILLLGRNTRQKKEYKQLAMDRMEKLPDFLPKRNYNPLPICLRSPFYGRTNNRVISIAKMLKLNQKEGKGRKLGLDRRWSRFYHEHFDHRSDVLLNYNPHGECQYTLTGEEAFSSNDWELSILSTFLPHQKHRDAAEKILREWPYGNEYISVHRRDLEGSCRVHARCSDVNLETLECLQVRKNDTSDTCTADVRLRACDMEYKFVDNPEGLPVVLFTDGQVSALDNTFANRFNASSHFFVEMWLMVRSKVHYGNPRSTVDEVVANWRHGRGMEPKECYTSRDRKTRNDKIQIHN